MDTAALWRFLEDEARVVVAEGNVLMDGARQKNMEEVKHALYRLDSRVKQIDRIYLALEDRNGK